jgi:hypothetical protein
MLDRIGSGKILTVFRDSGKGCYRNEKQTHESGSKEYNWRKTSVHRVASRLRFVLHGIRGKSVLKLGIKFDIASLSLFNDTVSRILKSRH